MQCIPTRQRYCEIVEQLYFEFRPTINDGFAQNVAEQVIAGYEIVDGSPVVYSAIEYEGGPVDSLGSRLNPYDILHHTKIGRLPERSDDEPESAAVRAQEALAFDLLDMAYADRDGGL